MVSEHNEQGARSRGRSGRPAVAKSAGPAGRERSSGRQGCFHLLAVVSNGQTPHEDPAFGSVRVYSEVEWLGHRRLCFERRVCRGLLRCLPGRPPPSASLQPCAGVPGSPRPHHTCYLLFCFVFLITILIDVRWCLTVVFICISRVIVNMKHLFMCLWATLCA